MMELIRKNEERRFTLVTKDLREELETEEAEEENNRQTLHRHLHLFSCTHPYPIRVRLPSFITCSFQERQLIDYTSIYELKRSTGDLEKKEEKN